MNTVNVVLDISISNIRTYNLLYGGGYMSSQSWVCVHNGGSTVLYNETCHINIKSIDD